MTNNQLTFSAIPFLDEKEADVFYKSCLMAHFLPEKERLLLLFLLQLPQSFKKNRSNTHLARLVCTAGLYKKRIRRMMIQSPKKRHVFVKLLRQNLEFPFGQKEVLGIFISLNMLHEREIFERRRIVDTIQNILTSVEMVDGSFLTFSNYQSRSHATYLEIEWNPAWHEKLTWLKNTLQEEMRHCIEELVPKTFMYRNEEEVYKNIFILRDQLKSIHTEPQAIVNFEKQTSQDLFFTVVLLRLTEERAISVQELIEKQQSQMIFIPDRVAVVGMYKRKYRKEATVFHLGLPKGSFFRKDGSVNLYRARRKAIALIEKALGPIRDYNGGLLQQQGEQLDRFLSIMPKESDPFFLENFFYSIYPAEMQNILPPPLIKEWFFVFTQLLTKETSSKKPYHLVCHATSDTILIAIRSEGNSFKKEIEAVIRSFSNPAGIVAFLEMNWNSVNYCGGLIRAVGLPIAHIESNLREVMDKWKKQRKEKSHLRVAIQDMRSNLDPRIATEDQSYIVVKMLFEGLTRIDRTGKPAMAIANSYEVSPDCKTYTFYLRKSQWSNGEPISAYDFEYSWKKALQPRIVSPFIYPLFLIKNARLAKEGKVSEEAIGVTAVSDTVLVVELEHPTPHFLEVAAHSSYSLINRVIDEKQPGWAYFSGRNYVCNGPFQLVESAPLLLVEKNPYYWDADAVKLDKISIFKQERGENLIEMIRNNSLDIIGRPMSAFPSEALTPSVEEELVSYPLESVFSLCFNTNQIPFNNKKMRQAFSYAVDRESFSEILRQEFEGPSYSPLPPLLSLHPQPVFPKHNIEKALQLFEEALDELNMTPADFPTIVLGYCSHMYRDPLFLQLQQKWQSLFGIEITLNPSEWKSHFQSLTTSQFHLGAVEFNALWSDPLHFFEFFEKTNNLFNIPAWEHAQFQYLLNSARQSPVLEKRRAFLEQAELLLAEEMPVLPLYILRGYYLKRKELKEIMTSRYFLIDFKWAQK